MLTAYIDESLRRRPGDDCVYAMAAVIADSAAHEDLRSTLEGLRAGKAPRLHWRDESNSRRLVIAQTLAGAAISNIVTIYIHSRSVKYARARHLCLERLLVELTARDVRLAVIESRTIEDPDDRRFLTSLRRSHRVPLDLVVAWQSPLNEPLLWAADAVVSAATWWLDGQGTYFEFLDHQTELICLN